MYHFITVLAQDISIILSQNYLILPLLAQDYLNYYLKMYHKSIFLIRRYCIYSSTIHIILYYLYPIKMYNNYK